MKRIIILLTFIPWILYYYSETKSNLKIIKNNKDDKNIIKNYLLELFPLNNLVLYGILFFFSVYYQEADNIFFVRIMLFAAINVYLFFSTISKKEYVLNFEDSSEKISLKYVFFVIIPIIFYLISKRYMITYTIMMAFNVFNYFLIRIVGLPKDEK